MAPNLALRGNFTESRIFCNPPRVTRSSRLAPETYFENVVQNGISNKHTDAYNIWHLDAAHVEPSTSMMVSIEGSLVQIV